MSEGNLELKAKPRHASQAVRKVRSAMCKEPQTIRMLMDRFPDLSAPQISMSLAYLMKKQEIQRQQIPRTAGSGRALIWAYVAK